MNENPRAKEFMEDKGLDVFLECFAPKLLGPYFDGHFTIDDGIGFLPKD